MVERARQTYVSALIDSADTCRGCYRLRETGENEADATYFEFGPEDVCPRCGGLRLREEIVAEFRVIDGSGRVLREKER